MGKIVKDDEVLLELGLSTTATPADRGVVAAAINYAEGAVRRYLGYDPVQLQRTEFYPSVNFGNLSQAAVWESEGDTAYLRQVAAAATDELQVRHLPIRSVASRQRIYTDRKSVV